MKLKLFSSAGVLLVFYAVSGLAQQPRASSATAAAPLPVATQWEIACTGFIAASKFPKDVVVADGADNDFQSPVHQFTTGSFVYLRGKVTVGAEYTIIRPARRLYNLSWYESQGGSIRSLGQPYEDVGRIKVDRMTPQGAIAEVTFDCGGITPGDIAVPYQARAIPEYTPGQPVDRFALPNGKLTGAISAARDNAGFLGTGSVAYLNLGSSDGARSGQRFRIFEVSRDRIEKVLTVPPDTPREIVGELVILSTNEKSSVAMVVTSIREIAVGDGVELE